MMRQNFRPMQENSLIDELESAVRTASPENRVNTLRRITDLFLHDTNRLNDSQIEVFDDVLCLLVERIERTALAELGKRLAPVDTAPIRVIKRLAQDDDITVATPVLTGSKRLTTADLVHIAKTKGQAHLLAISERSTLEPALTDVLVVRGEQKVVSSLAKNTGALFSAAGYNRLVERAEGDDDLSAIVGLRKDIPRNLLQELLRRATDAAIAKILSFVPPERRKEIEVVVTKIGKTIAQSTERDYSDAERNVAALVSSGRLDEGALLGFVQERQQDELIVGLARLGSIPVGTIAQLLNGHRNDAVLLPCKAAGLSWTAVDFILHDRLIGQSAVAETIEVARRDYAKLSRTTAHRTLRFMSIRGTVK
jgi:uncharacterized protein (DUF2336 family)